MLVEGMSMRGITRLTGVSINTVSKLLRDAGNAAVAYHDENVRSIEGERTIQCDEIWSFVYAKASNVAEAKAAPEGAGDAWTWVGLDTESRLIVSYLLSGARDDFSAVAFMKDLAGRLEEPPLLATDALSSYRMGVRWAFGTTAGHMPSKSGTSYVERQNLTMRMGMRRFARRTNGFSKRFEFHLCLIALHTLYYNFCRIHSTIQCSPAMAAGVDDHLHDLEWIVGLID